MAGYRDRWTTLNLVETLTEWGSVRMDVGKGFDVMDDMAGKG